MGRHAVGKTSHRRREPLALLRATASSHHCLVSGSLHDSPGIAASIQAFPHASAARQWRLDHVNDQPLAVLLLAGLAGVTLQRHRQQ